MGIKNKFFRSPLVGIISLDYLQMGMFSNACGNTKWEMTGLKHKEKICCKVGKYIDCP